MNTKSTATGNRPREQFRFDNYNNGMGNFASETPQKLYTLTEMK